MSLIANAKQLLARLERAETARAGVTQAQNLGELRKELTDRSTNFKELALRASVLRQEGVPVPSLPDLSPTKNAVTDVSARFTAQPVASTLKKGRRWGSLLSNLDTARGTVQTALFNDWKSFHRNQLFGGPPPDQLKARLPTSPANVKALERYVQLYRAFSAHATSLPQTREAVAEARRCSDALAQIKFEENVPDEVAKFYAATATSTGASLELLTSTVMAYLRENGQLDAYVVRARLQ